MPLAIEYSFWDERLREALLRFGSPMQIESGASTEDATRQLEAALTAAMQMLKVAPIARDASAFRVVLSGARDTGGIYGLGRRLRALIARRPLHLDHAKRPEFTNLKDKS